MKVYLDTVLVSGWAREDIGSSELRALERILEFGQAGRLEITTSQVTADEHRDIPEEHRREHERIYKLIRLVPGLADR